MINVEAHDRVSHDQNDEQDIHDTKEEDVCKGIEIEKVNGKDNNDQNVKQSKEEALLQITADRVKIIGE